MKFSLSTNWCNRRIESGEEIADKAEELGFDGLELGFHTTDLQAEGFKKRLDRMPVGSVHAFCPVPISAPHGYPELYQLASFDDEMRKMAQIMIRRNIAFAAEMGATALVLHAGRVYRESLFTRMLPNRFAKGFLEKNRIARGLEMIDVLKKELEALVPELEKNHVKLGLENLPYPEGFPDLSEVSSVVGEWVRPWLDTGHWYAMEKLESCEVGKLESYGVSTFQPFNCSTFQPLGFHLNDSKGGDDHLAPGDGKIDFSMFKAMMENAEHLVLEPNSSVTDDQLRDALARLKNPEFDWKSVRNPESESLTDRT